jgi:hypothetical protein
MVGYFLTDLAVSIGIVLASGRLFWASAGDAQLREALVTQTDIYLALGRFAPRNLLFTYLATISDMSRGLIRESSLADGFTTAAGEVVATIGRLALGLALAGPYTLMELYRQTSGTAGRVVLAGFGVMTCAMLASLFLAGVSRWRLLLALAASPFAASVVFLVLQGFMVLIPDAVFWFTSLAPYVVTCPVICTLYWIAFPNAERGATQAGARTIGLALGRWRG